MSQQQLDLVATMESLLTQTQGALAELKATLVTDPEPPEPPGMIFVDSAADLDAAIAEAVPGDNIVLANELVYTKKLTSANH